MPELRSALQRGAAALYLLRGADRVIFTPRVLMWLSVTALVLNLLGILVVVWL